MLVPPPLRAGGGALEGGASTLPLRDGAGALDCGGAADGGGPLDGGAPTFPLREGPDAFDGGPDGPVPLLPLDAGGFDGADGGA